MRVGRRTKLGMMIVEDIRTFGCGKCWEME